MKSDKFAIILLLICSSFIFSACDKDTSVANKVADTPIVEETVLFENVQEAEVVESTVNDSKEFVFPFTGKEFATEVSARIEYMESTDSDGLFDVSVPTLEDFQLEPTKKIYWKYNNVGGGLEYSISIKTLKIDEIDSPVTNIIISTENNTNAEDSFLKTLLLYSTIVPAIDNTLRDDEPYKIIADLITYDSGVSDEGALNFPVVIKNGISYSLISTNELNLMCSIDEETYSPNIKVAQDSQNKQDNSQKINWFNEDIYKIGSDLTAGEYYLIPTSDSRSAYFAVCRDSNGDDILENSNFDGSAYITVENGQYFEVTRAKFALASEVITSFDPYNLNDGMYLVGKDIPEGEYRLNVNSDRSAYVCVYNNSTVSRDIIVNDNFEGKNYITVNDGEYLELVRCTGELLQ